MTKLTGFLNNTPTVEKPPHLQSYASGDGSLSFVYIDSNGKATGQRVTRAQAEQHLKDNFSDSRDWKIQEINGLLYLVRNIERVNGFTLRFKDRMYRYSVNLATLGNNASVTVHDLEIKTYTIWNTTSGDDGCWEKVLNYSTLAAIKFFLNHEDELK